MVRRLLPLLVLPALAGCSSPHKIEILNDAGAPIEVTMRWRTTYEGRTSATDETWSLAAGDRGTEAVWFYEAPAEFTVRATSGAKTWKRTFRAAEYPASLRRRSSAGPTTRIVVRDGEIAFPTP